MSLKKNLPSSHLQDHQDYLRPGVIDLFDLAPVGYITLDNQGNIQRANSTAARLFKHERLALNGKSLSAWVCHEQETSFRNYLNVVLGSDLFEKHIFDVDLEVSHKAQPVSLELHSYPILDPECGPVIQMAMIDVSDRKRSKAVHLANRRLQEEKLARENFVSTLVHDLRTPLNSVKLSSQLLAGNLENEEKKQKLLSLLVEGVDRADRMIRDLLDFNRLEAGKELPISIRYCHLNHLVDRCLNNIRSVQLLPIDLALLAEEDVFGYWSHDSVLRMLENLVLNAIKYGDTRQPITVFLHRRGSRVSIRVHNFGTPVPPKDQKTLFGVFERTHSAVTGSQNGWGLGLSLVKSLAVRHNGELHLRSDQTHGTSFTIDLPLDSRMDEEKHSTPR
jgi:PAS domain S-box-containing protein